MVMVIRHLIGIDGSASADLWVEWSTKLWLILPMLVLMLLMLIVQVRGVLVLDPVSTVGRWR